MIKDVKQLKEKFDDFVVTKQGNSISIPLSLLRDYYKSVKWLDVVKGIVKLTTEFIIPSLQQRLKFSPVLSSGHSSTWNESHTNKAIISWMTKTLSPTININLYSWLKNKIAALWDGESKTLLNINFFYNKKVFRVLNSTGKFTKEVQEFLRYPENWVENVKELSDAVKLFQTEFNANKEEYMTAKWLEEKGFRKILDTMLEMEISVKLDYLTPEQEANAYQLSGECYAPQVKSNLAMSFVKTTMEEHLFYEGVLSKPLSWEELLKNTFIINEDNEFLYTDITKSIYDSSISYKEKDCYLPFLFLSHCIDTDTSNDVIFTFPMTKRIEDNDFLTIQCRTTGDNDPEGMESIQKMCSIIQRNKKSPTYSKTIANCYKILKYWSKFYSIAHKPEYVKIYEEIDEVINNISDKTLKGNAKKLRLLHSNNIFNLIQYFTIGYVYNTPNLDENHIESVYKNILNTFTKEWCNYLQSEDSAKRLDTTHIEKAHAEYQNAKGLDFSTNTLLKITEYAPLSLEYIGKAAIDFYELFVKDRLQAQFNSEVSTSTERKLLLFEIESKKIPAEEFEIYNPHGEITTWYNSHIGHLIPASKGGQLQKKKWIFENESKGNDDGRYKLAEKDMEKYYVACANITETQLEKFHNPDIQDTQLFIDISTATKLMLDDIKLSARQLELRNEYKKVLNRQKCLKTLFEFHDMEYKTDSNLHEDSYIIKFGK